MQFTSRDSALLNLACCSFYCILVLADLLENRFGISIWITPSKFRRYFHKNPIGWLVIVFPTAIISVFCLWLGLRTCLPENYDTYRLVLPLVGFALIVGSTNSYCQLKRFSNLRKRLAAELERLHDMQTKLDNAHDSLRSAEALETELAGHSDLSSETLKGLEERLDQLILQARMIHVEVKEIHDEVDETLDETERTLDLDGRKNTDPGKNVL